MAAATRNQLLQAARADLSAENDTFLRACVAQDLVQDEADVADAAWAIAMATDILKAVPLRSSRATYANGCLQATGQSLQDLTITRGAAEAMRKLALASGS